MTLNRTKYTTTDYDEGDDSLFVVGRITMQDNEVYSAEILDSFITSIDELRRVKEFLKIVEAKMLYAKYSSIDVGERDARCELTDMEVAKIFGIGTKE